MVNRLKVSVGMTTYNSAKYIKEQLDSIFSQTILPDELVICDDSSTDDTVDILKNYVYLNKLEDNVKIIVNEKILVT